MADQWIRHLPVMMDRSTTLQVLLVDSSTITATAEWVEQNWLQVDGWCPISNDIWVQDPPPSKAYTAVVSLRAAADAYDALPSGMKSATIFGAVLSTDALRREADAIEARVKAYKEAMEP